MASHRTVTGAPSRSSSLDCQGVNGKKILFIAFHGKPQRLRDALCLAA